MTASEPSGTTDNQRIGSETTIPVLPTHQGDQYQHGELTANYCKDGIEIVVDFGAGPVYLWLSHEDGQQLGELLQSR